MPLDTSARSTGGKIGGHTVVARYGGEFLGERLRAGLQRKFERQVVEAAVLVGAELTAEQVAERAEQLRLANLGRARKALQDKAHKRRKQRLEAAERVYIEARRAAGLPPVAETAS
ncbi:MAG TPA: hypothetical protein VMW62_17055 [Chloroflexota bacterium]|nr:hypothetical protein [Chloroflexota bacterium]